MDGHARQGISHMAVQSIRQVEVDKAEAVKMIASAGADAADLLYTIQTNFKAGENPTIDRINYLADELESKIDALEVFILGHDPMNDI